VKHYAGEDQRNLDHWTPYTTFVHNITVHASTVYCLFKPVFGYKPRLPSGLSDPLSPHNKYEDYVLELRNRLQTAHEVARRYLISNKNKRGGNNDRKTQEFEFMVGYKVLLHDERL
jgi:hypothetical protein